MEKSIWLAAFLVALYSISAHAASYNQNDGNFHGRLYYAGEQSTLDAMFLADGVNLKQDKASSVGSRGGINLSFGSSWFQNISVDLYSTKSMVPDTHAHFPS